MKITPLEIRQKTFEKNFRGYDKDEVTAFLQTLSQEWERMVDQQKELKFKLEAAQEEVRKLREVESSLFKTLKTAEDTGSSMVEQAKRTAELHLKESQMKAEAIISESRSRAKSMIENAEHKSRQLVESMEDEVKMLEQTYKTLENYRENLISDLRNIANDTLEKADRAMKQRDRFSIDEIVSKARSVSEKIINQEPIEEEEEYKVTMQAHGEESGQEAEDAPLGPEEQASEHNKEGGSFFDQIS